MWVKCQGIFDTLGTLFELLVKMYQYSLYEKPTVVFSPQTPRVTLARFACEDHAYGALCLPKTTVLQFNHLMTSIVSVL